MAISTFHILHQNDITVLLPATQHTKPATSPDISAGTVSMSKPAGFTHAPIDSTPHVALAKKWQPGNSLVQVVMSVFIKPRWYTGQKILHVQSHNSDITFTFICDQGTVRVEPGGTWKHGYKNNATAIEAMEDFSIVEAWQRGRQLARDEITVIIHPYDTC